MPYETSTRSRRSSSSIWLISLMTKYLGNSEIITIGEFAVRMSSLERFHEFVTST